MSEAVSASANGTNRRLLDLLLLAGVVLVAVGFAVLTLHSVLSLSGWIAFAPLNGEAFAAEASSFDSATLIGAVLTLGGLLLLLVRWSRGARAGGVLLLGAAIMFAGALLGLFSPIQGSIEMTDEPAPPVGTVEYTGPTSFWDWASELTIDLGIALLIVGVALAILRLVRRRLEGKK